MGNKDEIVVVTVCDNHYILLLAALIKSIESNHLTEENLIIYVVDDSISSKNKLKLESSIDTNMTSIFWIAMNDVIPENMNLPVDKSFYPANIYMRLFIPYFIPQHIKKVLYLDVDMIMLNDISKVWNIEIGSYPLGAVIDSRVKTFDNEWGGIKNYKSLNLKGNLPYFNTGLLLINTEAFRDLNIAERVLLCVADNQKFLNYPDQYGLNILLANNWYSIDPKWNFFSDSNSEEEPYLVHFTGRKPIYQSYPHNYRFKNLFFYYLDCTPWKNTKPISELRRYFKILKNKLNKQLL